MQTPEQTIAKNGIVNGHPLKSNTLNGHPEMQQSSSRRKDKQEQQETFNSLLPLFGTNYCACQNDICKGDINRFFRNLN